MIHILIERTIAEDMLPTYIAHSTSALQHTYAAPGFISAEAFAAVDNPYHRFLLCKWRSSSEWKAWYTSQERLEFFNLISPTLVQPEKVTELKAQARDSR